MCDRYSTDMIYKKTDILIIRQYEPSEQLNPAEQQEGEPDDEWQQPLEPDVTSLYLLAALEEYNVGFKKPIVPKLELCLSELTNVTVILNMQLEKAKLQE